MGDTQNGKRSIVHQAWGISLVGVVLGGLEEVGARGYFYFYIFVRLLLMSPRLKFCIVALVSRFTFD